MGKMGKPWGGSFTIGNNKPNVLPHPPLSPLIVPICFCNLLLYVCIIIRGDYIMTTKTSIETQLDCRATAALNESVLADLSKPDLPMNSLVNKEEDKEDEPTDQHSSSS
jgi:hypothetical protein